MISLLNLLAFLAVAGYAVYLFINLVYTRYLFIKLGKKAEFEPNLKERINTGINQRLWPKKIIQRQEKRSDAFSIILYLFYHSNRTY